MLKQHNYHIFGTDDPSHIFFNEKVYSIEENNDSITLVLKIPFAKNALLDVQKKNDELVITLEHDRGILANIIILPFAAVTMNLVSSKIINNQLVILLKR